MTVFDCSSAASLLDKSGVATVHLTYKHGPSIGYISGLVWFE